MTDAGVSALSHHQNDRDKSSDPQELCGRPQEGTQVSQDPILTYSFVLVIVRQDDRFLLAADPKHNDRWFLPAGRLRPGDSYEAAASRLCYDQTHIPIELDGILGIEHTPLKDGSARHRVIYTAQPKDQRPPKSRAYLHSVEANWFRAAELEFIRPRSLEVFRLIKRVSEGAPSYPLNLLSQEGRFAAGRN